MAPGAAESWVMAIAQKHPDGGSPCPHCDRSSPAFAYALPRPSPHFSLVCNRHSLVEGHLLLIPHPHLPSIAQYDDRLLREFEDVHARAVRFLGDRYGPVAVFEHGTLARPCPTHMFSTCRSVAP